MAASMADNGNEPIIQAKALSRTYRIGSRKIPALQEVDLEVEPGKFVALRGRSGSGKTTLLNCIGGLDKPTSGEIWLEGRNVTSISERNWVKTRRRQIGFVFQGNALLMTYSARENVDLMLRLAGMGRRERRERSKEVLTMVGLRNWMDHRPFELSGGQQQRVAIARAIATRPALILADEPTGALDSATGRQILQLFRHISVEGGTTVLIATHDLTVDAYADNVYLLQDGHILEQ